MSTKPGAPRVLSLFGSLATGAPQSERFVRIANGFGGRMRHFVVAGDGNYSALKGIDKGISVERLGNFPGLSGMPLPGRLQKIARAMLDYHLVLTWGWGAVDGALAHTMFSQVHELPPLIHHEDGSDEMASGRNGLRSKWYRRVGLGKSSGLVVPTELMEGVALVDWQQPIGRVKTIPDGVALDAPKSRRKSEGIGRLIKREGEGWIGCFTGYGENEPLEPLLDGLRGADHDWYLILVGEGPRRLDIEARAKGSEIEHRVHFLPANTDRAEVLALCDAFAVSGGPDPLPLPVIDAMAAGLPVCGVDPGEVGAALSEESAAFIRPAGKHADVSAQIVRLTSDDYLREQAGKANRERAAKERDAKVMIASYRRLYASAMKRDTL